MAHLWIHILTKERGCFNMHVHYPNIRSHPYKPICCMFCKKEIQVTNVPLEQYIKRAYGTFNAITFFLTISLVRTYNHLHHVLHESLVMNLMIQNFAYFVLLSLSFLIWMAYVRLNFDFEEIDYNEKADNTERNEPRVIPRFTIKNLIAFYVFPPDYKTEDFILYSKSGLKLKPRGLSYQQYRCDCFLFDTILGEFIAVNTAVIYHHAKFGLFTLPLYLALLIDILLFITVSLLYAKFRFAFIEDEKYE